MDCLVFFFYVFTLRHDVCFILRHDVSFTLRHDVSFTSTSDILFPELYLAFQHGICIKKLQTKTLTDGRRVIGV